MNGTKYQVRIYDTLSKEFRLVTKLKRDDALHVFLFNIALEKVISECTRSQL